MNLLRLFTIILLCFIWVSCSSGGSGASDDDITTTTESGLISSFQDVTPAEAWTLIQNQKNNSNFVILDIRTAQEFSTEHLEQAVNLVDYYSPTFREDLDRLDKQKTYLIYCRTGKRSAKTKALMQELSFSRVYDLLGGITAWKAAGYPTQVP